VTDRLVVSIAETAELLGLSDDLVYHLVARGELPCLRFGRRKVIPWVAVERIIELAMDGFDATLVVQRLRSAADEAAARSVAPRRIAEHAAEERGDLAVTPRLEVRVHGEGCLPSPTVADAARNLRKLHAGTKKRRHDEVTEPVQMDLLVEADAIPQGPEPAAG
jgi:excisionase family DNA binding protein